MAQTRRRLGLGLVGLAVPLAALMAAAPAAVAQSPEPGMTTTMSEECTNRDLLPLKNPGRLTLSTDNPAFPPWWGGDPEEQYPGEPEQGSGWDVSDPYSGEGYEGAVAYAVAENLGFSREAVDWLPNAVFELAFQPGPKAFDWHMAQVSIRPERAQAVDFSDPYFDSNQSIIAMTGNPITEVTTIEDLRQWNLGAAVATTSFQLIENVIQPEADPQVFADNASAIQALQNGQIDGLVVDLYTAFYIRDAQLEDWDTPDPEATIVGQFSASEQVDQMGMVLEKDSALTACVNEALQALRDSGELQAIYDEWIATGQNIPFFE
jgi:polar amino acid transport system substrate-binding protein